MATLRQHNELKKAFPISSTLNISGSSNLEIFPKLGVDVLKNDFSTPSNCAIELIKVITTVF